MRYVNPLIKKIMIYIHSTYINPSILERQISPVERSVSSLCVVQLDVVGCGVFDRVCCLGMCHTSHVPFVLLSGTLSTMQQW